MYHIPKSQLAALNSIFGVYDITHIIMPKAKFLKFQEVKNLQNQRVLQKHAQF